MNHTTSHSSSQTPLGRLAPSPTGALHLGNARSFLLAWLSLRSRGGNVLLRIEDLDGPRCKPGAVEQCIEDLDWLGLHCDGDAQLQSLRKERFDLALAHLEAKGLVYPCVCTRSEIERAQSAPQDPLDHGSLYPGTCRDRFATAKEAKEATGLDPAWRFRLPKQSLIRFEDRIHGQVAVDVALDCGDFVVARKNTEAAYQLAVVVDDGDFGINEVLRGDDLLRSTARQILLFRALGFSEPVWIHVPLVCGEDGRRVAKRHGDTRIASYRRRGIKAEEMIAFLAFSCGLRENMEPVSAQELVQDFDLARISKEPFTIERDPWS